jgi:hypothetical protein
LREHQKTEFLLSERAPAWPFDEAAIRNQHYLAVDGEIVRGGLLIASYPAYLGTGENVTVLNYREPLSEGIIDSKYTWLGLRLLKFVEQNGPYVFSLGMGSENAPFPRLLRGAGWSIRPVPFLFRVLRAGRFLTQLRLLQTSAVRRFASRSAAMTGIGRLGIQILQRRSLADRGHTRGLTFEKQTGWGSWANELWDRFRTNCSFGVRRDQETLAALYNTPHDRSQVFRLYRSGRTAGWIACQVTQMHTDKYFGEMKVATILDGVAIPEAMRALLGMAVHELDAQGTDIIITNQSHTGWIEAFRRLGFLTQRSNYILATNKRLTHAITGQSNGWENIHFTRGDGDGRFHL